MTVTKPGGVPHDQFAQFVSSLEQQFGAQFDTFWKSMEGQIEAGEESSAAAPTRHLGKDVQVRLGQRAPIETSRESEDLCISVWMTDATFDIGGKSVTSLQVQTSAALYVNGRLLVIFGYRTYENESDVTALKDPTRSWADRIAASNERPSD